MAVRDLAPSLLALGDLFAEASLVLNEDAGPVALSIDATGTGSFDVRLIVEAAGLWDQFVDIFSSDQITALVNLQNIVIGGGVSGLGLLGFLRHRQGRRISEEEPDPISGQIRVTYEDGMSVEVPADVVRLHCRFSIRRKARDVIAPLNREGVDELRFSRTTPQEPDLVIQKEDIRAYEEAVTEEADILSDDEREMYVQVSSVSFEGGMWRLSEGNVRFWASIEDLEFLAAVDEHKELFGKGDILRCRIRIVQSRRPGGAGLKTEYHVVKVLEHLRAPTQPELWEGSE